MLAQSNCLIHLKENIKHLLCITLYKDTTKSIGGGSGGLFDDEEEDDDIFGGGQPKHKETKGQKF
jgi:hypothetical protein